ncbi:MAG TPA: chloride channel protein [Candidatus Saccharimonadia bacterium]|nr:chloride channel protein [Candidatus Saccharimonadia bacterium]
MKNNILIKTLVISVVIGLLAGVVPDLFIRLLQATNKLLWHVLIPNATGKPWAVVMFAITGGLLMGLCVKHFGVNQEGIGFEAVVQSMKQDGELGVKQLKRVVVNSYVGLATGASIGPESALVTLGGYTGDWVGKRLGFAKEQLMVLISIALGGSMGILLDSPVVGPIFFAERPPTKDTGTNNLLIFSSMVAASVGFAIYVWLKAPFLKDVQLVPVYPGFRPIDLIWGLIIGIIGAGIGLALKTLILRFKEYFRVLDHRPVVRGVIVGLTIGVCGAIFPLVLFDGSAQLSTLVKNVSSYSVLALVLLCVVRLFTTAVALSGGYQGGNIFPTIFICGAAGLAISAMFPFIPASVAMVACMAPAMYVFIPLPLFSIFLFTEISNFTLIPVMGMALVSAFVISAIRGERSG